MSPEAELQQRRRTGKGRRSAGENRPTSIRNHHDTSHTACGASRKKGPTLDLPAPQPCLVYLDALPVGNPSRFCLLRKPA